MEILESQLENTEDFGRQVKSATRFETFKKHPKKDEKEEIFKRRMKRENMISNREKKQLKSFNLAKEGHK